MNQSPFLQELGLSKKEANIYQIILRLGTSKSQDIIKEAKMPRGTVYKTLDLLIERKLIDQTEDGHGIFIYKPRHPYSLKELVEQKEQKARQMKLKLDAVFPDFINLYSQAENRPGVKFYEGKEGVKKVLNDVLTSKTEILSYGNVDLVIKNFGDINKQFVKKRNRLKIKKRRFVLDTPLARKTLSKQTKETTDTKLMTHSAPPYQAYMQIYDNKTAFITLKKEKIISYIIADPLVYEMQKYIFDYFWSLHMN